MSFLVRLTMGLTAFATALALDTARSAPAAPPASPAPVALAGAAGEARETWEENPRVLPGLVVWHPSAAGARAAAQKSGRPVLVFHMMGQLDRQFC